MATFGTIIRRIERAFPVTRFCWIVSPHSSGHGYFANVYPRPVVGGSPDCRAQGSTPEFALELAYAKALTAYGTTGEPLK